MIKLLYAFIFFLMGCSHVPLSLEQPNDPSALSGVLSRANSDLKIFDDTVAKMKAEFSVEPRDPRNKDWVKKKLKHMVAVDQYLRNQLQMPFERGYAGTEKDFFLKEITLRFKTIDSQNTSDLKELLKIYSWFVISEFGEEADSNAWILVQHADEAPDFQKQVLGILGKLYKKKETNPKNYAYLFDRVAASFSDLSKRKPQRYGTQGQCVGSGKWEPNPIENPKNIDLRRAEVGLGPMAEYIAGFKHICH